MQDPLERQHLDRSGSYTAARDVLRFVGPMVLLVGGICMVVALVDFFKAFGSWGQPKLFWLFFIGGPLLFVGAVLTSLGFAGAVARYQATQIAPVGKDVVNYMAHGTQDGVRTAAGAIAQGLREGFTGDAAAGALACPRCHAANEAGSQFCDQCGAALTKTCTCGASNQPDSQFCDQCGKALT